MKKVLLTEPIHEDGVKILEKVAKVEIASSTDENFLTELVPSFNGILIRKAKITKKIIDNAENLEVIAKHGVGVDNIDISAATTKDVKVINAPESNSKAVIEHTILLILATAKNLVFLDNETRKGNFKIRNKVSSLEINGKTAGLIGLGNIGIKLSHKLKSLGLNIIGYDPYLSPKKVDKYEIKLVNKVEDLYLKSDIISLHLPLNDKTSNMINEESFSLMKNTAIFINTARGGIVNENDLYKALSSGEIQAAAVDVFANNPPDKNNPLFQLDNFTCTPHSAALTKESLINMAVESAEGVKDCFEGRRPDNLVNSEVLK